MSTKIDLDGTWELSVSAASIASLPCADTLEALPLVVQVPTTVATELLRAGLMPDPYDGQNEAQVQTFFDADYAFERVCEVSEELLEEERIELVCEGLVTLAKVFVNGTEVGTANNMHRTWHFDVKPYVHPGTNSIRIEFASSRQFIQSHENPLGNSFALIRQASCMFGWDWGISLPDMGIWKSLYILGQSGVVIDGFSVTQEHTAGSVELTIEPQLELLADSETLAHFQRELLPSGERTRGGYEIQVQVYGPDGSLVGHIEQPVTPCSTDADGMPDVGGKAGASSGFGDDKRSGKRCGEAGVQVEPLHVMIPHPQLWHVAGYGDQPLYTIRVTLESADCRPPQTLEKRVGLRTVDLCREPDGTGAAFAFVVNGEQIFVTGENLVIDDALLMRTDHSRWRRHIDNCRAANVTMIRVWGGAYYPDDEFYDMCDEAGILVWQDLMFASSFYLPSSDFMENVAAEVSQQAARLASHPCLALLCGNNEIESVFVTVTSVEERTGALRKLFGMPDPVSPSQAETIWDAYRALFLEVIPREIARVAPTIPFVHSSPSTPTPRTATSFFDYADLGDMHYYFPYDGNALVESIQQMNPRFMSEMGFQSYPAVETLRTFVRDRADLQPYSPVMLAHQKSLNGNQAIELYMRRDYAVPHDFVHYVYLSQLMAGRIMEYSVGHFRAQSDYCRGVILWQLNDCWPVVSWSGVDYYGRWKAQQYFTKRFYAPVIPIIRVDSAAQMTSIGISNIGAESWQGMLRWRVEDNDGAVVTSGEVPAHVGRLHMNTFAEWAYGTYTTEAQASLHIRADAVDSRGQVVARCTQLLVPPKDFAFPQAGLHAAVECDSSGTAHIRVRAEHFTMGCELYLGDGTAILSDNFFDLDAGEERIVDILSAPEALSESASLSGDVTLSESLALRTLCLNDVMRAAR